MVFGAHRVSLRPDRSPAAHVAMPLSLAARVAMPLLCAALLSACIFGPTTVNPSPSPNPTTTASAGPTRPRFELATYQYGLQTKGKIRVALRDASLPMSTRRANGGYDGFEADIAREIAKAIWGPLDDPETHIEWVSVDASTRIVALTSNQADITLAGLVTSDDNKKVIDLSDPYLHTGQRLLVRKSNDQIKELADVVAGDQTVCAIKGSVWAQNLSRATIERAKILELDTMDFCLQALASGAADAITSDELILFGLTMKDPNLKVVGKPFTDDLLGIGMKKNASGDRQGFSEFVNLVLLTIVADRTWARLYEKDMTPVSGDRKQLPTD